MSDWLIPALEELLCRARREQRQACALQRYEQTRAAVGAYLEADPEASANAVHAALGGRRADVLRAVREARTRYPEPGNHQNAVPAA